MPATFAVEEVTPENAEARVEEHYRKCPPVLLNSSANQKEPLEGK